MYGNLYPLNILRSNFRKGKYAKIMLKISVSVDGRIHWTGRSSFPNSGGRC